jgi:hypothetical protein
MNAVIDEKRGYENYWNTVRNLEPPAVPFIGKSFLI